ncbi:MAG: ATP-dependent nuclease [Phycisphaerae bacterium]
MRLISKVSIEGFRSIRQAELEGLSGFTALAGLNNSGKSNTLRALNAFFNDETDPGNPIDVDADYHRPDLRKKKRKRIRVTVEFALPPHFQFRKGLEAVRELLGGTLFSVAKEWTRTASLATYFLNGRELSREESHKLSQFLGLIKFRYIPNRVLPTEVIRSEHQNLRDVLIRRLARRAAQDKDAFEAIQETSTKMIASLAKRFREACPGQGNVTLATPTSWQQIAFAFGYRLGQGDVQIEDVAQGSGIQSLLMLETLYLVDRDYFQQFGWRQAAVWAVEEPEASLHSSLEARVAAYLAAIANDPASRLQVLSTTHSDLMVQYAGETAIVTQENGESRFRIERNPRKVLDELSTAGVSRWVHPLLHFPLDPVILVEGEFDVVFLEKAFQAMQVERPIRVADQARVEGSTDGGGVERLRKYIKDNASAIQARRPEAPVVVLLDWDARSKVDGFASLVPAANTYKALAWPDRALNPKLGRSFKGIERAYSDRIIQIAIKKGVAIGEKKNREYVVSSDDYGEVKRQLADIVRSEFKPEDLAHCREFLEEVLSCAGVAP